MAARAKVLQSFELVEQVLLRATTHDLLAATAVCTAWRAVIENSITLHNYILSTPVRKSVLNSDAQSPQTHRINSSNTECWLFSEKNTNKSSLFILRIPKDGLEVFLLAPNKQGAHLKVFDDAYDMYCVTTDFRPNLEFRQRDGKVLCRTDCKPLHTSAPLCCSLRPWLFTKPKDLIVHEQDVLRRYLSTFYGDFYGPGVKIV